MAPGYVPSYRSKLLDAISDGQLEVVRLAIAEGAQLNESTTAVNNPLCRATRQGADAIINVLLDNGACVRLHKSHCVVIAVHFGRTDLCQRFHDLGARLPDNSDAMRAALYANQMGAVRWLMAHDAQSRGLDDGSLGRLLHLATAEDAELVQQVFRGAGDQSDVDAIILRATEIGNLDLAAALAAIACRHAAPSRLSKALRRPRPHNGPRGPA